MSGCFKVNERIEDRDGIIKEIKHTEQAITSFIEFAKINEYIF